MLLIGYLTLFFLRENFEVRIMTSLTSLLVMATLFSQVRPLREGGGRGGGAERRD